MNKAILLLGSLFYKYFEKNMTMDRFYFSLVGIRKVFRETVILEVGPQLQLDYYYLFVIVPSKKQHAFKKVWSNKNWTNQSP